MKLSKFVLLLAITLTPSLQALADFGRCNTMFPHKRPPKIPSALANKTRELCFTDFAILYSIESKTPVYSIERLSYLRLGTKEQRVDNFHEEQLLPRKDRSTLEDYAHSGYDRGHMAPAADMTNALAMFESFSLANMVPQAPKNNRGVWSKRVEAATRKYVKRAQGDVYVFTGPIFAPDHRTIGKNRVWVPTSLFKLVYDQASGRSWVFLVENTNVARIQPPVSAQELTRRLGFSLLD